MARTLGIVAVLVLLLRSLCEAHTAMPNYPGHLGGLAAAAEQGSQDSGNQPVACCARLESAAVATLPEGVASCVAGDGKAVIGITERLAKSASSVHVAAVGAYFIAFAPLSYYARSARILR